MFTQKVDCLGFGHPCKKNVEKMHPSFDALWSPVTKNLPEQISLTMLVKHVFPLAPVDDYTPTFPYEFCPEIPFQTKECLRFRSGSSHKSII